MSSTRKTHSRGATRRASLFFASVAGLVALDGCTTAPPPTPEPVSGTPIVVDEAMQRRDWPQSTAQWANADVVAGATRFPYEPQTEGIDAHRGILGDEWSNSLLDTGFFVAQSVALPFTYFWDKPFVKKVHQGVIYEPTHYA